jgi:tRNA pseudouridine55 synthase
LRRAAADPIDGVLALDKPLGVSSNLALQAARRLLQARKAGHTGTLDPLASGLLPLTFGEATKFSADLLEADKEYQATLELGVTTSTGDAEGHVLERRAVDVVRAHFEAVLLRFVGQQQQVPPMHSALKHEGRPLYELARQGQEVERAPRSVRIARLALVEWDGHRPKIEVECSKGTYVRVLVQDIGAALGCGAHLQALRRTRVGHLRLEQATSLAELEKLELAGRRQRLLPVDFLLASLARVTLDEGAATRFGHGQRVARSQAEVLAREERVSTPAQSTPVQLPRVRVYDAQGRLLGVARDGAGWLEPTRLVAQAGTQAPVRANG